MGHFDDRQWQIRENRFSPETQSHAESIMTVGNGYLGIRASLEEGYPNDIPATFTAGIFNHKQGQAVPELVNLPNWLALHIEISGETFSLNSGTLLGYERVLDLKHALLTRRILWMSPKGLVLRLQFERFASIVNQHVAGIQVKIAVLSKGTHHIKITSSLNTRIRNPENVNHWGQTESTVDGYYLYFNGTTDQSDYSVAMQAHLHLDGANPTLIQAETDGQPNHQLTFQLNQNEEITATKLVAIHTSRDANDPASACTKTLIGAINSGYETLKQAHIAEWEQLWEISDIVIKGDEIAQRAVRFCLYHLLIAVPRHDQRISIGAKSLSGFGYKGHIFWDTEIFLVPSLILTQPELAQNLLMYRYHTLSGAHNKATEAGYEGAMFPWESTDTGEETTPRWLDDVDVTGKKTRIWTGDHEQHISSDIAYATIQYWRWTKDDDWFAAYGAELVLDTAKFWGSRAEHNPTHDRYELSTQIGPDEYHENVDNNAFVNRLVQWHLQQALEVWEWLKTHHAQQATSLGKKLDLSDERLKLWRTIAEKMWIPTVDQNGTILEQFKGFFDELAPVDLGSYTPRTIAMNWILGQEEIQNTRIIKQADVVMLMALLGEELGDEEFLRRNWDVYSTIVDHGSSLSASVHARVAARLGLTEEAYELFITSATLDLDDRQGNTSDGIHIACCGGVVQAVLFGFCGLQYTDDGIKLNPRLPEHWQSVEFKVFWHGQLQEIALS